MKSNIKIMNLKLEKIKRRSLVDYSTFSDFIKKKNGKIVFTQGLRNISKLNINKKPNHLEEYERKLQFLLVLRNFNEIFHIKNDLKNNTIDNKAISARSFFPKNYFRNHNILQNKTINSFNKYIYNKKKSFSIKSNKSYKNNNMKPIKINRDKIYDLKKEINNKLNNKEIYEEFKKIIKFINNDDDNEDIKKKKIKIYDQLIKNKSDNNILIYPKNNYDNGKKKIYKKIKSMKNESINRIYNNKFTKLENNKEDSKDLRFNNHILSSTSRLKSNSSFYNTSIERKLSLNSIKKNYSKLKIDNRFKNNINTIEDGSDIFKVYDFDPDKTFLELKKNFNFIEDYNYENNSQNLRNKYIMKIRKILNKNSGIKFHNDLTQSKRRISIIKRQSNIK